MKKKKATPAQLKALSKARAAKKRISKIHRIHGVDGADGVDGVDGIDGHKRRGVGAISKALTKTTTKGILNELKEAGLIAVGIIGSKMIEKKVFTSQEGLMGWLPGILQMGGGVLLANSKNQLLKQIGRGVTTAGIISTTSKILKKDLLNDQVLQGLSLSNILDNKVNGIGAFDAVENIKLPAEYRAELPLLEGNDDDIDGIDDIDDDDDIDGLEGRGRERRQARRQRRQDRRAGRQDRRISRKRKPALPPAEEYPAEESAAVEAENSGRQKSEMSDDEIYGANDFEGTEIFN